MLNAINQLLEQFYFENNIDILQTRNTFNEHIFFLSFFNLGIHGEHTESVGGVYDISNKRRLGLSEIDAIQEMRRGVEEIIKKEKSL